MAFMGDLGDIIDKAEGERFVGREHEIESFRQHISSTPVLATWIICAENWLPENSFGRYVLVFESTTLFFEEKIFQKEERTQSTT